MEAIPFSAKIDPYINRQLLVNTFPFAAITKVVVKNNWLNIKSNRYIFKW